VQPATNSANSAQAIWPPRQDSRDSPPPSPHNMARAAPGLAGRSGSRRRPRRERSGFACPAEGSSPAPRRSYTRRSSKAEKFGAQSLLATKKFPDGVRGEVPSARRLVDHFTTAPASAWFESAPAYTVPASENSECCRRSRCDRAYGLPGRWSGPRETPGCSGPSAAMRSAATGCDSRTRPH